MLPAELAAVPSIIAGAGDRARRRFLEFFAATIRNKNTRAAYARATRDFFVWCDLRGLQNLDDIEPLAVAAYVEQLTGRRSAPTVKQHLAALRMLFDWLVTGQVIPHNPASACRVPCHVVRRGKTTDLSVEERRLLLVGVEIFLRLVMRRHLVPLAALLVQPQPGAPALAVIVPDLHPGHRADAGKAVDHHGDDRAVAEPDNVAGLDASEQLARLLNREDGRLAAPHDVARPTDCAGRVVRDHLASHQPGEQHP